MEQAALRPLLGYLNFSSGTPDAQFERGINEAFAALEGRGGPQRQQAWRALHHALRDELAALAGRAPGFESIEQATAVLYLLFDRLLPEYRRYHRDLLAQHTDESLFRPLFIAKAAEAVLSEGGPWSDEQRIIDGALVRLNNFIGYRPVAVLRTTQKIEPYAHEWVCPIPLYIAGAGVGAGAYHDLIAGALDVLRAVPWQILDEASFDPELLSELALDPRAYDFDHPANKRPNYQFGGWDLHTIDNSGRYRRFVLQAVTLDALLLRVDQASGDRRELLHEAAVVLTGTMLMAAGVSGRGPETHDSGTTLARLLPKIAGYRDAFYRHVLAQLPGAHGQRLRAEAEALRQPFAGARHDLNQRLARLRAEQLQRVHLSQLFAAMGNREASSRQAAIVPVASARMLSEISGCLTIGGLALHRDDAETAAACLTEVDDLLRRGIECGALIDPWNILGFGGQFPLFPALENSVRDHRVDVLIHLMAKTFALGVQIAAEASAAGADDALKQTLDRIRALAAWWDKFATLEVSAVESVSGRESVDAAEAVAAALSAWRAAGATGGNLAFWRQHIGGFRSPHAYAVVIETLLAKQDFVAAMGLLIAWLSAADDIAMFDSQNSFYRLAEQWLTLAFDRADPNDTTALVGKFFDYLEANAGELWDVPRLAWQTDSPNRPPRGRSTSREDADALEDLSDDEFADDGDEEENPYGAAYEGVTYLDTTDDGIEGATLSEGEPASDYELEAESTRLRARVAFLRLIARMRASAALNFAARRRTIGEKSTTNVAAAHPAGAELAASQLPHAIACSRGLADLLTAIDRDPIPKPTGTHSALLEYDRRRRVKESLIADAANAAVEARTAVRWLRVVAADANIPSVTSTVSGAADVLTDISSWETTAEPLLRGMLAGEAENVRQTFSEVLAELDSRPILFVPLSRGGDPAALVETQSLKQFVVELLSALPRLGLAAEAGRTIAAAAAMERHRPRGEKAVTEFDRLFETGFRSLIEALVDAAVLVTDNSSATAAENATGDAELVDSLQTVTEPLLRLWLEHSQSVRLSALEKVAEAERWKTLVSFIERYGRDLFTQQFLNLGSLRAILDRGVPEYLRLLEEDPQTADNINLLAELDRGIPRAAAIEHLQTVIEAIVESYAEYKDFNTTTTQSDHGELLYMLLDFLRLKRSYERVVWNIRPLCLVHEILMRRGQHAAAEIWRRMLAEQTRETADAHLAAADALSERYGMRLPSITARLAERLVRPLSVDALRALVAPAIAEARTGAPGEAFARLEQEIDEFAEQAVGSGIDVPPWLVSLEEEAAQAQSAGTPRELAEQLAALLPATALTPAAIAAQFRGEE